MKHGFVKAAAATPDIRVADVRYNQEKICEVIQAASDCHAKILVFPEPVCYRLYLRRPVSSAGASRRFEGSAVKNRGIYERQRYACIYRHAPECGRKIIQCGGRFE